jgi:hypothetical protein
MSQRFGSSSLHQRDSRSALFEGYAPEQSRRPASGSPSTLGGGYGYGGYGAQPSSGSLGVESQAYRPATPNRRGQYSDAVLSELESQNDAQVEGILGKVKTLKSVSEPITTRSHRRPHCCLPHCLWHKVVRRTLGETCRFHSLVAGHAREPNPMPKPLLKSPWS